MSFAFGLDLHVLEFLDARSSGQLVHVLLSMGAYLQAFASAYYLFNLLPVLAVFLKSYLLS